MPPTHRLRGLAPLTLAFALAVSACGPSREPALEPGGVLYDAALRASEASRASAIAGLGAHDRRDASAGAAGSCSVFVPGLGEVDADSHRLRRLEKGEAVEGERGTFAPTPALSAQLAETARFLPPEGGTRGYLDYVAGSGQDLEIEPALWLSKAPPLPLSHGCYARGRRDYAAHVTAAVSRAQAALHAAGRCQRSPSECVVRPEERARAERALARLTTAHKGSCAIAARTPPAPMRSNEDDAQYQRRMAEDARARRSEELWLGNVAPTEDDLDELARTETWRSEELGVMCAIGHLRTVVAAAALLERRAEKARADEAAAEGARERREHEAALARRFQPIERECAAGWLASTSKCAELPNLSEAERATCQARCADATTKARADLLAQAMRDCLDDFVSRGPSAACKGTAPAGAPSVAGELAECTRSCRKSGPEAKAARAREAAEQRRAAHDA
ncbi:MAG TPA: hypothetical protein PLR99_29270, partial [Polyangiaceae bacterium]|nr:hypothetical protein [Polyangiaceae bacterium]